MKDAFGAKNRSWVGEINGKVISTEIVVDTLAVAEIIKSKMI